MTMKPVTMGKENKHTKNGYTLSKQWFEWVRKTDKNVRPIHGVLYLWIVELNNRMEWKEVFELPSKYSMESTRIIGKNNFLNALNDLIEWGFITMVKKSVSRHHGNQISINLLYTENIQLTVKGDNLPYTENICQTDLPYTENTRQNVPDIYVPVRKTRKKKQLIQNKKEEEAEPNKSAPIKTDFIDLILIEFQKVYKLLRNVEYEITNKGKERAAIGKLLNIYKKNEPDKNAEETLTDFRLYFERCIDIPDSWLYNNMSPAMIASKFNEIRTILSGGHKKGKGATDLELAGIFYKHFGKKYTDDVWKNEDGTWIDEKQDFDKSMHDTR